MKSHSVLYPLCPRSASTARALSALILLAGIAILPARSLAGQTGAGDLTDVPLESLLNMEVYSASRYVQNVSEAPSAVSVLTAADIKTFGWRTLAEALRSLPGLYTTYNRTYSQLGARGFSHASDRNPRFLLLIDGNRANNPIFDQAMLGSEFAVDIDLVERIEYVPGPGSSMYGSNALYGVINVITKRGRDMNGWQVSGEAGSFGARKGRVSHGWKDENGGELLLSATSYHVDGKDQYYPEYVYHPSYPPDRYRLGGVARNLDYDRGQSVFLKGSAGPFGFSLAHAERTKGDPAAAGALYGQSAFNAPGPKSVDDQTLATADYRALLAPGAEFYGRVFFNRYDSRRDFILERQPTRYPPPPIYLNREDRRADWWGGEIKLVGTLFDRHKLVAGAEYQKNDPIRLRIYDVEPYSAQLDAADRSSRAGVYLQDDWQVRDDLTLILGVRRDHSTTPGNDRTSPRLGAIYRLSPATTVKALYGKAYRLPNGYELNYAIPAQGIFQGIKTNPGLEAERIRSTELVLEHRYTTDGRIRLSAYRNQISNLAMLVPDPDDGQQQLQNVGKATARGVEAALEQAWPDGARLRASYSWQQTRSESFAYLLDDSPQRLAKLNLSLPFHGNLWRAGIETLYVSSRPTWKGKIGGHALTNLTLFSDRLAKNVELSASVYNLFDKRYADPAGLDFWQVSIPQDGRSLRLKLTYGF